MTAPLALPPRERTHLLVVEDEPTIRHLFSSLLTSAGFSVAQAQDGFDALEEIRRQRPALILSDLNMPRMSGFELLSVIRRRFPAIHVIAMSGAFDESEVPPGIAADAYYQKSGRQIGTLVEVIETILSAKSMPDQAGADVESDDADPPQPEPQPRVALWVAQRGTPIDAPHILLACPECLRSFPHSAVVANTMKLQHTPCIFCGASIAYALLDPNVTHHPGFAPTPL